MQRMVIARSTVDDSEENDTRLRLLKLSAKQVTEVLLVDQQCIPELACRLLSCANEYSQALDLHFLKHMAVCKCV